MGDGTLDEVLNVLLLFYTRLGISDDDVNFVLEYDDLVELHDVDGGQMFTGLRLWAGLVACHEKKG